MMTTIGRAVERTSALPSVPVSAPKLRKPLGVAMVGGLIFSQVLTLYTTPVIYIFFDNLGARFSRRNERADKDHAREPQPEHA